MRWEVTVKYSGLTPSPPFRALQGGEGRGEVGIFNFSSTISLSLAVLDLVPAISNHTRSAKAGMGWPTTIVPFPERLP